MSGAVILVFFYLISCVVDIFIPTDLKQSIGFLLGCAGVIAIICYETRADQ